GYGYTEIQVEEATPQAIADAIVAGKCTPHGNAVPYFENAQQQVQRLRRMLLKFSNRNLG
ncbi:MAG: hypothetical protein ACQCN4_08605, partial [Candidatus Bathyarchaeia archaeon]